MSISAMFDTLNAPVVSFAVIDWTMVTGLIAFADLGLAMLTIIAILAHKRESTSALAWCLFVLLVPFIGMLTYLILGSNTIRKPLRRKKFSAEVIRSKRNPTPAEQTAGYLHLGDLARRLGASPVTLGNEADFYPTVSAAYDAMLDAIRSAQHHVHLEFFIIRPDATGDRFVDALTERAAAGVEVRFLYDAVGSWRLQKKMIRRLTDARGESASFLPLRNPLWRRMRINLRNHRKLLIVDGSAAFTGGLNIGDEYLGKNPFFGPWTDVCVRVKGPAVRPMQQVFIEDWAFASDRSLPESAYCPDPPRSGTCAVQAAWSGPDHDVKVIREVYFAAIMRATKRVWLASPYFVPDAGLLDALCVAARSGRDVRILCPMRPDKWIPHLAGRYHWQQLLQSQARVFQYVPGFMHTKLLIVDDEWVSIGSPNFDNRSFLLNFEFTYLFHDPKMTARTAVLFEEMSADSVELSAGVFARRPFVSRLGENVSRLFSPIL